VYRLIADQYKRTKGEDVHRLMVDSNDVSSKSITVHVACYQYLRLRQHYEAALRRREQVEWASNKNRFVDTSANRLAAEVKYKALEERNAAKDRMTLHKQSCPVCNRMRKPSQN
jgi:hypothetical protein